ncbi:hypothetical protein JTE90_021059 [Oedothorax gibbosus]|uniref:Sm domain-containing protein n=1 Tax=Oedothorax gibbosus TaxID=931172 RepID=A0AAV6VUA7_9ARAC|nr:hypothetical protein JTE90_021059 [Oedothorax gibbosus]
MSSHRRHDDDRRRDSDRRRRSPSSSPVPKEKRSDDQLPEHFGRDIDDMLKDERNVLQKMGDGFNDSPLAELKKCIDGTRKIKVYTRNFKEVRGICTGYVLAFDKHWNIILVDADEAYLRPRTAKTPYLEEVNPDAPDLPDLPPRVPKKKKTVAEKEGSPDIIEVPVVKDEPMEVAKEVPEAGEVPAAEAGADGETKKKKRKRRKKKKKEPSMGKRNLLQVFIRGDNIVMISILDPEEV